MEWSGVFNIPLLPTIAKMIQEEIESRNNRVVLLKELSSYIKTPTKGLLGPDFSLVNSIKIKEEIILILHKFF